MLLWFHKDKQARMSHRYKVRTGIVEVLPHVSLAKQITDNLVLTQQGFESADADPHEFTELFAEPMPEHLRIAAHLEADLWVAVHTTLDGARNRTLPREEYARLAIVLNDARGWAKATLPTYQDRKEFFEGIVNGDPDPVELVREGREAEVLALIEAAKQAYAPLAAER